MSRPKCYHTMDAFVKLVVVLVRYSGEPSNTLAKVNLLNKVGDILWLFLSSFSFAFFFFVFLPLSFSLSLSSLFSPHSSLSLSLSLSSSLYRFYWRSLRCCFKITRRDKLTSTSCRIIVSSSWYSTTSAHLIPSLTLSASLYCNASGKNSINTTSSASYSCYSVFVYIMMTVLYSFL